jgi:hypothetical protein
MQAERTQYACLVTLKSYLEDQELEQNRVLKQKRVTMMALMIKGLAFLVLFCALFLSHLFSVPFSTFSAFLRLPLFQALDTGIITQNLPCLSNALFIID